MHPVLKALALVAVALAPALAGAVTMQRCSWDHPGADPFMGGVPAAVDRYTDIPAEVRERLKERMLRRDFDEMASIRRDSITGRYRYSPEIRDMHFGTGRVCRSVTRSKWAPDAVERGLVYCEGEHCIIVPTVCRNVSRVTRLPGEGEQARGGTEVLPGVLLSEGPPGAGEEGTAGPLTALADTGEGELVFDPPGAGNSFSEAVAPLEPGVLVAGLGPAGALPGLMLPSLPAPGASEPGFVGGGGIGMPLDSIPGPGPGSSALLPLPGVPSIDGGSIGGGGIPPIPEPSTWLMMLAGLGAVSLFARRRRTQA